jgi:hypothetical protein
MIQHYETTRTIPFYRPVPLTDLPLVYHREHLFPYTSYGDTETTPAPRAWRMAVLENEFLRLEVAPELGGRVYSLFDKRVEREVLFSNPVVKPVRILPIWAFISGGIEFNFPIAHSPTSIAEVGCASGRIGDYGYIRVGEREARTGMEWAVEWGLAGGHPILVQRTALRNATGAAHPWMMWTIAALRSTEGTEFVHPPHRVLLHDDRLAETDWPGEDLNWDRHYRQMSALFWKPGSAPHFGVYHHDLGLGLMHVADPAPLPGKKVWTYGHGKHRVWANATTEGGLSYLEIESGPLLDQSEKPLFPAGSERRYEEFWVPVHSREACDRADPGLGWRHSRWQTGWEQFRGGEGPLPASTVPTGIDLEPSLRGELARGNPNAAEPLALWLAFHDRPREALALVENHPQPAPQRIAGLILWKGLKDPANALAHLEAGPLDDPVAVVELDAVYAELGLRAKRMALLERAPAHRLITERRADLALALGKPGDTLRLLSTTAWPREHQRYVRTDLWKAAKAALGEPAAEIPDRLNEDHLARFGAYWSDP